MNVVSESGDEEMRLKKKLWRPIKHANTITWVGLRVWFHWILRKTYCFKPTPGSILYI